MNFSIKEAITAFKQAKELPIHAKDVAATFYNEVAIPLRNETIHLSEKRTNLEDEYINLLKQLCEKKGEHTWMYKMFKKPPRYFSSVELKSTCIICGKCNDEAIKKSGFLEGPELCSSLVDSTSTVEPFTQISNDTRPLHHKIKSRKFIKQDAEQNENLELQAVAKRLLDIEEEITLINNKLADNRLSLQEICEMFGHDIEIIYDPPLIYDENYGSKLLGHTIYECKCCGKEMSYEQYVDSHKNSKFGHLGIVPFDDEYEE